MSREQILLEWAFLDPLEGTVEKAYRHLLTNVRVRGIGDFEPVTPIDNIVDPLATLMSLSVDGRMVIVECVRPKTLITIVRDSGRSICLPALSFTCTGSRKALDELEPCVVRSDFALRRSDRIARTAAEMYAPGRLVPLAPRGGWYGVPDSAFDTAWVRGKRVDNPTGMPAREVFSSALLRRQVGHSPEQLIGGFELVPATDLQGLASFSSE